MIRQLVDMESVRFMVGVRVRARARIVENDVPPDSEANPCEHGWVHCEVGDEGTVRHVNGNGPTVWFDRSGTGTLCFPWELDFVAPEDPHVPFPQADDMCKVLQTPSLIANGLGRKEGLAEYFNFDKRQAEYYGNAARYLGLAEQERGGFTSTAFGRAFASAGGPTQRAMVVGALRDRPVFREGLLYLYAYGVVPRGEVIEGWIREHAAIHGATLPRRAKTVASWLAWVLEGSKDLVRLAA